MLYRHMSSNGHQSDSIIINQPKFNSDGEVEVTDHQSYPISTVNKTVERYATTANYKFEKTTATTLNTTVNVDNEKSVQTDLVRLF